MKLSRRVLLALFGASCVYLLLLAYSHPLFAHELTTGGITVHSTKPIPRQ